MVFFNQLGRYMGTRGWGEESRLTCGIFHPFISDMIAWVLTWRRMKRKQYAQLTHKKKKEKRIDV